MPVKSAIDQRIALNKSTYIQCYYIKALCQILLQRTDNERGRSRVKEEKDEEEERETQTDRGRGKEEEEEKGTEERRGLTGVDI